MTDTTVTQYLTERRRREQQEAADLDARGARLLERMQAAEQPATPAAAAAPSGSPSAPRAQPATPRSPTAPAGQEPRDATGFAGAYGRSVAAAIAPIPGAVAAVGGLTDAAIQAARFGDEAVAWFNRNLFDLRSSASQAAGPAQPGAIPNVRLIPEQEGTGNKLVRGVVQFVGPFLGAMKIANAAWKSSTIKAQIAKGMAAGGAVDFAAFDPHEARLSNMLLEFSDGNPVIGKSIMEYLAASPADSRAEGRLKNFLEGMALGGAAEGLFLAARGFKGLVAGRGKDPAQAVMDARAARQQTQATQEAGRVASAPGQTATGTIQRPQPRSVQEMIDLTTGVTGAADRRSARPVRRGEAIEAFALTGRDNLTASGGFDNLAGAASRMDADGFAAEMLEGSALRTVGDTGLESKLPRTAAGDIDFEKVEPVALNPQALPARPPTVAELPDTLRLAEEAAAASPRQVAFDPAGGSLIIRPGTEALRPTELPLELYVTRALDKAPIERTAEDLVALRAYRQMQEAAFPGIIRVMDEATAPSVRGIEVIEAAGGGARTSAQIRRMSKATKAPAPARAPAAEAPEAPAPAQAAPAREAEESITITEGETVLYNGGASSGEVLKILKGGKVSVRDDLTGAIRVVTPDAADPLEAAIRANENTIKKATKRKGKKAEGGFIAPQVLAQMASAMVGGVAGFAAPPDDATLADRLMAAGFLALAGLGVSVGAARVFSKADLQALRDAPEEVKDLAKPLNSGIAPKVGRDLANYRGPKVDNAAPSSAAKASPRVPVQKVQMLARALSEGQGFEDIAKQLEVEDFNFRNMDSPEEIDDVINAFSSVFEKEIDEAKRGKMTFDDIREVAEELGAGTATMRELYQDTNNLSGRVLAHRTLLAASAGELKRLANAAKSGASIDLLAARKQVAFHAALQARMKGVQSEIARALASFRIQARSQDLTVNEANDLIDALGGRDANVRFAQQLSEITDRKKIAAVSRGGALARSQDALYEAWINGILSAPATHVVNGVSNVLVALNSIGERYMAAGFGALRNDVDRVTLREANAYTFGMVMGLRDTLRISAQGLQTLREAAAMAKSGDIAAAREAVESADAEDLGTTWKALATDEAQLDRGAYASLELGRPGSGQRAISGENLSSALHDSFGMDQMDPKGFMYRFTDALGTTLRVPGRFLATSDELFKSIHYRGELHAQALRMGNAEGLEGPALAEFIAKKVSNPDPALRAQAINVAREGTFTSPLHGTMLAAQRFAQSPGLRYIFPFMRTPINIMRYSFSRFPLLGALAPSVQAELKAGGARRDLALGKLTVGSVIYGMGALLAGQGMFTPGGDKNQSAENFGGAQPYSFKIGEKYFSVNRLDPFGQMLGIAADSTTIFGQIGEAEAGEIAGAAVLSFSRNVMNKSYLSGAVELLEALFMSEGNQAKQLERWFVNFGSTFMPFSSLSAAVKREVDPMMREVDSLVAAYKARIPGMSTDLPPRRNYFGEPMPHKNGLGPDIMSPVSTTTTSLEPAAREIHRLNLDLQMPPKTIGGAATSNSPGIDLTPKQHDRLLQLVGEEFKARATKLVGSSTYQNLPEDPTQTKYVEAKELVIRKVWQASRAIGQAKLLAEDRELRDAFVEDRKNTGRALRGQQPVFQ